MGKITLPGGAEIYNTENEQSPEEMRRKSIEAQVRSFHYTRYLLGKGENPATSQEVQEKMRTEVEEEMRRLKKGATDNVIPFPGRNNLEEKEGKRRAS